jgi:two-component system cell cycle sensor histidine kinase/response regulator CckA
MSKRLSVLIVEDSEDDALLVARQLERGGYEIDMQRVDTLEAMAEALDSRPWDVVIADYAMPGFGGMAALDLMHAKELDLPFIIVSGTIGEESAVAAMKAGAYDYVMKDNLARLVPAVEREIQEAEKRRAGKLAEEALWASEARFRKMAENIQDGLTIVERGRVVYLNDRACEIFGCSREELMGLQALDLADPGDQERFKQIFEVAGEEAGRLRELEFWIRRPDGTRRYIQNRYSVSYEAGEPVGRYIVTTDITERKLAEREVEERRMYLERVLAAAPDAIVTLDAEHRVVEWNSGATKLFGYSREEALGQDLDLLINSSDALAEARDLTATVVAGKELAPTEMVRHCQDGTPVDVIASASPIVVDGKLVGVVAVYTDISERKRAERLLQALNEAALNVEQALTVDEILDTLGQELSKLGFSHTVLLVEEDEGGARLRPAYFSYDPQAVEMAVDLLGTQVADFFIPLDMAGELGQVIRQRKTLLIRPLGAWGWVLPGLSSELSEEVIEILGVQQAINAPLIVDDRAIGLLSVQSDDLVEEDIPAITAFAHQLAAAWRKAQLMQDLEDSLEELKRTQAQFLQAQKMEAIGRLAGGVAHDFNNALTIIRLSTQLLQRQLRPEDPLWTLVEQIEEAGNRAATLTKQLLSFSRREVVEPRNIDLNRIIRDMSEMMQRIIGEDIDLLTTLEPELWPVYLDPVQIDQVILNLAINARDAMPYGGTLSIQTENVVLDEAYAAEQIEVEPGEYVMLAIRDTGVGMDDTVKAHLFEPFFTTKERGKGTGLGLASVYGIVKRSGGHIWVYSEVGEGTTFKVYFPHTRKAAVPAREPPPSGHPWTGSETVLLVEDDAAVREMAAQILSSYGHQVLMASSGPTGLQLAQEHEGLVHLLLTDVVLPQMSGKELAERLQALRPEIRVIYMSGYSASAIAHHGVGEEDMVLLTKPFTVEALMEKVRSALDAVQ